MAAKHPIQPLEPDARGVLRFKANAIVQHLLEHGGTDLNRLAMMDFTQEDREQFAQLIGYSLTGFGDLSYVSSQTYDAAQYMHDGAESTLSARLEATENRLAAVQEKLRPGIAELYGVHPDDLSSR